MNTKKIIKLLIAISFICVLFYGNEIHVLATDSNESVTITVYESPVLTPTKTITIEKGGTIALWIPTKEAAGLEGSEQWRFIGWYLEDLNTPVTAETRFYTDSSIYASWERLPEETPPVAGDLSGENEVISEETLLQIQSARPSVLKLKNVKGKRLRFQLSCEQDIDGYEILFATNKKFKKAQKLGALSKEKQITLNSMKKGKTYYIKARGYKEYNNTRYYTKWSKVKKVKIKK